MNFLPVVPPKSRLAQTIWLFLALLFLAVSLKLWNIFELTLGRDESLYALVSRSWLKGHIPYTEIWDNKPAGIYILYSAIFRLFGQSTAVIKLFSCAAIALTGAILFNIGRLLRKKDSLDDTLIGLIAAVLFVLSMVRGGGLLSANTEVFLIPLVAAAYYLLFRVLARHRREFFQRKANFLGIGLLLGLAFIIKYIAIYDLLIFLAIVLFHAVPQVRQRKVTYLEVSISLLLLLVGFALPFGIVSGYFLLAGNFSDYVYANFIANKIRVASREFSLVSLLKGFLQQAPRYFPLWIGVGLLFYRPIAKMTTLAEGRKIVVLLLWLLTTVITIVITYRENFYSQYFLPFLPSLSLLTGIALTQILRLLFPADLDPEKQPEKLGRTITKFGRNQLLFLLVVVCLAGFYTLPDLRANLDFLRLAATKPSEVGKSNVSSIANYIQTRTQSSDYIYVSDYYPAVYFLTNNQIPTRYAFPDFLVDVNLSKVAGIDPLAELSAIMAKRPVYVIRNQVGWGKNANLALYKQLDIFLEESYFLEKKYFDAILYRRKGS